MHLVPREYRILKTLNLSWICWFLAPLFVLDFSRFFGNSFPVTWQDVRPFRTQVRDLINSGSETVGLGEKICDPGRGFD